MKIIKAADSVRQKQIKDLYLQAFPQTERKPFELMLRKQTEGTMELLSLEDENGFLGLAVMAYDKDLVLLDYFAIMPDFRGQGVGSRALKALQKIYTGKRFFLEIETTKKPSEELKLRKKRKAFYLQNGLHPMNFDVNLFGVEMEVLANCESLSYEEYLALYKNACGLKFADKISLIKQIPSSHEAPAAKTKMSWQQLVKTVFFKTLPVMAGYIVLGIGFGILLKKAGYGVFWSFLMSFSIYAGSMQYVTVSLLTSGASLLSAGLTALMVNARHLFYGISMIEKYKNSGLKKPYLIFSLTDETYSLLCGNDYPENADPHQYSLYISIFNQLYWITGSVIGSILGTLLQFNTAGIEFSMTALFVTVFVEQWISSDNHLPAICGLFCSSLCLVVFGPDHFLIPSMVTITIVLALIRKNISLEGGTRHE